MTVEYKDYTIEIIDDSNYTLNSTDNIVSYNIEYFGEMANTDKVYPTSKHGLRIREDEKELTSAIICEVGTATTIHNKSFIIKDDTLLICCCDKVYSLKLPALKLNWKKRLDPATCFGIYSFKDDFIIHGELEVTRIDIEGNEKWKFGARDIFVTPGKEAIDVMQDKIKLRDWEGYEYLLDENGQEVR